MSDTPNNKWSRRTFVKKSSQLGASAVPALAGVNQALATPRPVRSEEEFREVIIVGSGFGGAISAYRLTKAGIAVTMLEQGRRWDQKLAEGERRFSPNLYPDGRSTFLSNTTVVPLGPALPIRRTTGVLQGRKLAGKTVLNGAAWGGGSITWGGVMVMPEERIYAKVFPKEIPFKELLPHYQEVGRKLGRSEMPDDVLESAPSFEHIRLAREHCEKSDIKWEKISTSTNWDIVRDEIAGRVPASITAGEAIYGVNSGAKGGLDRTYLREAEQSGLLEVKVLHQVQDLKINAAGHYVLEVNELDIDGRVIAIKTFTCAKLFLAAGCVASSSILVKAKAKNHLPNLNDEVGRGFGNNGNAYALRWRLKEKTGRVQGGPPALGINELDNPLTPLFIEHPQLPVGIDIHGLLYFGIGITPTRGTFRYEPESDSVTIDWPKKDEGQAKVNEALLNTLEKMNESTGGSTTSLLTLLRSKVKDDICYHALGGLVIGKATDFYGRVHGYPGLYVNDSSLMPGSSGCCNPAFTIAALAERNIQEIVESDFR